MSNYTVVVAVAELDERGDIVGEPQLIRMDRMCTYDSADSYACSAIDFIEEGMAFNDEPYRPGCDPEEEDDE